MGTAEIGDPRRDGGRVAVQFRRTARSGLPVAPVGQLGPLHVFDTEVVAGKP
jgi:hypothetical protein